VPEWMHKAYAGAETPEGAYALSVATAFEQCETLIDEGVEHLHVYTLNNPDLTYDVCRTLGYAAAPLAAVADGYGAA
jgi:methylenetetrahydrofolate reductase (NADPH)